MPQRPLVRPRCAICGLDHSRFRESLPTFGRGTVQNSETRDIRIVLRDRTVEFKGLEFLQVWALPNFFFHHVTAYNLLRHNGVEIGKRDFLGVS